MKSLKNCFLPKMTQYMMLLAICCLAVSCGDDDDPGTGGSDTGEPISSFQFEVSDTDWRVVNFTNFSQNADSFTWDFGDGNTSTDRDPQHSYDAGGDYEVTLTASDGTASRSSTKRLTISDPDEAIKAITGETSKTWKLFREGVSMSVGPSIDEPGGFWPGLSNDGSRPCLYTQELTFHLDGTYEFNDNGEFWAEFGLFNNVNGCDQNVTAESCFEATAANMVNACGDDVSAWLSGTHSFEYDPATSSLTLNGEGAWIGIPKLATNGEVLVPQNSVTTKVTVTRETGYDVMLVEFIYAGTYWPIRYASYSDPSLEPELVTDAVPPPPFGEDLPDISPTELSRSFASVGDAVLLDTIPSGSSIAYGADNPDGSGELVGQFDRVATDFQELQMQTAPEKNDINFENLSTISLDIYLPSSNDYSTTLTKNVVIGFGDTSQTEQWWTGLVQYEAVANDLGLSEDAWHTITFDLNSPSFSSTPGQTPFERNDLDMVYIGFGGSGHPVPGTFYVRNFVIN